MMMVMFDFIRFFVGFLTLCHVKQVALSVRIIRLDVPSAVLNGSVTSVTLDCEFEVDASDRVESPRGAEGEGGVSSGLVIKWFHSSSPEPVYQWIPGYPPQAFGLLRDRVSLGHVTSDDPLQRHRAVHVTRPGTDLSGDYLCKVTTWSDVAVASKQMIIYAPAKSMSLWSSEPKSHKTTLTCEATGIYPDPEVRLIVQGSHMSRVPLGGLDVAKTLQNGAYKVVATRTLDDRKIASQCLIYCEISLPGTGYSITEKILHIRGTASHSSTPYFGTRERLIGRPLQYFPDEMYLHSGSFRFQISPFLWSIALLLQKVVVLSQ